MAARLDEETTKLHIHLYSADLEELDATLCRSGQRTIGRSEAIRNIVRAWLIMNRKKQNAKPIKYDPEIGDIINGKPPK
jgi:metal-responsive CopG/Arc/MetJ family transcriptional regulator